MLLKSALNFPIFLRILLGQGVTRSKMSALADAYLACFPQTYFTFVPLLRENSILLL
jgi:hypothetical protein